MAFATIGTDRTNTPARTAEGAKGVLLPATGNDEVPFVQSACIGCSKVTSHGSPCAQLGFKLPYGEKRHENVPATEKVDAQFLHKLQVALWNAHYVVNGVPRGTLFNLGIGTANNISQQQLYEITSASGNTLTLKGRDPRLLKSPLSITNPNYPLDAPIELKPDDVTLEDWNGTEGETDGMKFARLIPSGIYHSLPLGSAIQFEHPSILAKNVQPYIKAVSPPSGTPEDINDVTFTVECTCDVSNARQPYDKAFPPAKYYCTVYFYAVAPEAWGNFQTPLETWYTKHTATFTKAQLDAASGFVLLKDTAGNNTRVLFPSMATVSVSYTRTGISGYTLYSVSDANFTLTQSGDAFTTSLDLTDLLVIFDIEEITISYCPQALETDTWILPYQKSCSQDQEEYTSSYVDSGNRRCMNIDCEKYQNGDYVAGNCWKTSDATGFVLGDEQGTFPTSDAGNSSHLSRLWNRTSFIFEQGMPGNSSYRNFAYKRPAQGGPSIAEISGSYHLSVPTGMIETKTPLFSPRLGQRREWVDDDDTYQEIIYGAYEPRTYESDEFGNITDKGFDGHFAEYITGWTSRTGYRGTTLSRTQEAFPLFGPSSNSLYNYTLQENGMAKPKTLSTATNQVYSTGNSPTVVLTSENSAIQGII